MSYLISDYRRRMELLAYLGWERGKAPSEYAKAVAIWHFGSNNGQIIPGRAPFHVPARQIAMFLVHYAPVRLVNRDLRRQLIEEFGV